VKCYWKQEKDYSWVDEKTVKVKSKEARKIVAKHLAENDPGLLELLKITKKIFGPAEEIEITPSKELLDELQNHRKIQAETAIRKARKAL